MLVKVIIIFLLGMALIGMIGKALFPAKAGQAMRLRRKSAKPPVCGKCGRYVIGQTGCDCRKS